MLVSDFVPAVTYQATGKINSFVSGSTKWLKILALGNSLIQDWANEPDVDWNSLYAPDTSIGTVIASKTYSIQTTIRKISDQQGDVVRILHTDGISYTDYDIVNNDRQKDFADYNRTYQDNYIIQVGPTIQFNRAFTSTDPQFGGTITVPGYTYPATIALDTDPIVVDIPNWLVYATAAQYDSTDVTRQQLVPRLEAKANELMQVMKDNNNGQITQMFQPWRPGGYSMDTNGFIQDNY